MSLFCTGEIIETQTLTCLIIGPSITRTVISIIIISGEQIVLMHLSNRKKLNKLHLLCVTSNNFNFCKTASINQFAKSNYFNNR